MAALVAQSPPISAALAHPTNIESAKHSEPAIQLLRNFIIITLTNIYGSRVSPQLDGFTQRLMAP